MTKQEFLEKFEAEKLNIGEQIMVLDRVTDEPLVMGCAYDQEKWKVYKTKEHGGHYIIKEADREDEAFNLFYELVVIRHNRIDKQRNSQRSVLNKHRLDGLLFIFEEAKRYFFNNTDKALIWKKTKES